MEVAKFIDRIRYIPFITEHLHPRTRKAPLDSTYKERLQRHARDNPDQLYLDMIGSRLADAQKLQEVIDNSEVGVAG